jgi:cytochrome c-type biogenesis protein CcmE
LGWGVTDLQAKTKLWIGILTVAGVLAALITMGMSNTTAFYMTIDEVAAKKSEAVDKPLKVSGKIVGDSVRWDADQLLLSFQLEGESGNRLTFEYTGVKPDTFNDEWEAIVDGRLQPDGVFVATDLLVKCPSKYEAMEEAVETPPTDHLKE